MFIFIGALPRTDWLGEAIERDDRGFILTGPDIMQGGERPKGWTQDRDPFLLETTSGSICRWRCPAWFREARGFRRRRRIRRSSIHSSVLEQGLMSDALELLKKVPVFRGIPEDQIEWFFSKTEERHLKPDETYARQGEPADSMFVCLRAVPGAQGISLAKLWCGICFQGK